MKLEEIKELIALMRKNKIKEINLEEKDSKVRIVAGDSAGPVRPEATAVPQPVAAPYFFVPAGEAAAFLPRHAPGAGHPVLPPAPPAAPPQSAGEGAAPSAGATAEELESGVEIKSPMVGTFYRAPAPDAPAYVEEGSSIGPDTVLCIIEAMKLMNEIKAEMRGRIVRVLVENGQPVEFNQPLFLVEPL